MELQKDINVLERNSDDSNISVEQLALGSLSKSNVKELLNKISQDILFLEDRIERILKSRTSNEIVLKTYEGMLESRKAVLETCRLHARQTIGE